MSNLPNLWKTIWAFFYVVTFNFLMLGCTNSSVQFNQLAKELGFDEKLFQGAHFSHKVYFNRKSLDDVLHVYLGSDGTPWKNVNQIASDPTPRNPVMLRLMALDSVASVYVGRPCYHGLSHKLECNPKWWTSGRYSEPVVSSLDSVILQIAEDYGASDIILFGYSGGGALAMLVAEKFSLVHGVVTVAGNLDIDAWIAYHSYSPLTESMNPVSRLPLREEVLQFHFAGSQDEVVPPYLLHGAMNKQPGITPVVIEGIDHQCCWEELWPGILRTVNHALENSRR